MLYRDLLLHLNVTDTSVRRHVHSLDMVQSFEFGEVFQVVMRKGIRIDIRNLDTLLECIIDEFKAADTYDYTLGLLGGGKRRRLVLAPKPVMGVPWGRDVHNVCSKIRDWITEYTLSEQWPEEVPDLASAVNIAQGRNRTL